MHFANLVPQDTSFRLRMCKSEKQTPGGGAPEAIEHTPSRDRTTPQMHLRTTLGVRREN